MGLLGNLFNPKGEKAKTQAEAPKAPPPAAPTPVNLPTENKRDARMRQEEEKALAPGPAKNKKGGAIKKYARGGGIEARGKTRGKFI
jgi:hypothetical protein